MNCNSGKASQQVRGPLSTPSCQAAPTDPSEYLQATCDMSDIWATYVNKYIKYL